MLILGYQKLILTQKLILNILNWFDTKKPQFSQKNAFWHKKFQFSPRTHFDTKKLNFHKERIWLKKLFILKPQKQYILVEKLKSTQKSFIRPKKWIDSNYFNHEEKWFDKKTHFVEELNLTYCFLENRGFQNFVIALLW